MTNTTAYIFRTLSDGDLWEADVEVEGHCVPYRPAKIDGPPERCHPEEGGEVEDIRVTLDGVEITHWLTPTELSELEADLLEQAARDAESAYEEAAERRAEARRDWDLEDR